MQRITILFFFAVLHRYHSQFWGDPAIVYEVQENKMNKRGFFFKLSTAPFQTLLVLSKKGELNTKKVQLTNADTAKSLSPSVLCVYIATLGMSG